MEKMKIRLDDFNNGTTLTFEIHPKSEYPNRGDNDIVTVYCIGSNYSDVVNLSRLQIENLITHLQRGLQD